MLLSYGLVSCCRVWARGLCLLTAQTDKHNCKLQLSACSCDSPFDWHFNPKAEIMQCALHIWPLPICLNHHLLHHCYLLQHLHDHWSAVVCLSWANKSPAGILKHTLARTHFSREQEETREGKWKTHEVMPESEGKWAAGVLTGETAQCPHIQPTHFECMNVKQLANDASLSSMLRLQSRSIKMISHK